MLLRFPEQADPGLDPATAGREASPRVQCVGCFEGWSLVTLNHGGEPAWLAGELVTMLELSSLAELRAALETLGEPGGQRGRIELDKAGTGELVERLDRAQVVVAPPLRRAPLILLRAAAVEALVARVATATARRLWAHLRDRVVPEFHAQRRADARLSQPILSPDDAILADNQLEFERRCFEAAALEGLLVRLAAKGRIDPDQLAAHRLVASEIALGGELHEYEALLTHGWSTPSQIAARFCGLTPMRVGRVIAHIGLKGSRSHSRTLLSKARGHARTVLGHAYSPAAVALIERELQCRGYRRCLDADPNASEQLPPLSPCCEEP